MTLLTKHKYGTLCWADMAATEVEKAQGFYSKIFGWESAPILMGPEAEYYMQKRDGYTAAAIFEMPPEAKSSGMPPAWSVYVSVSSVDEMAKKAKELGGKVAMGPMNVLGQGRLLMIEDPTGGHLGLWETIQHIGAEIKGEPGSITWAELLTDDPEAAARFYTRLLGWTAETQEMPSSPPYTTFSVDGEQVAGMMKKMAEWGDLPSYWGVYFRVSDCAATVALAKAEGAEVIVEPQTVPGAGTFASLQDPGGAYFSVLQPPDLPAANYYSGQPTL